MKKPSNNNFVPAALLLACAPVSWADEGGAKHFTDSSTDRIPAITAFPKYPSIARRDRIEGETVVCFMIDVDGSIRRPAVQSSTHKIFEKPAMRAIRRSSFEPLAEGEDLSRSRTCRTYRFRLDPITLADESLADETDS